VVGTTIFTVMSALATEHKAPSTWARAFPTLNAIRPWSNAVTRPCSRPQPVPAHARRACPAPGRCPQNRGAARPRLQYPNTEITITAGATQAILTAILAIVHPGDEVIVLDPCYDSYVPNIELAGGKAVRVPLTPGSFRPDFAKISRRHHAAHPRHHHQQPAQPQRHRLERARTCASCKNCSRPPTSC
jgi:methionine aminotransferase